MAAPAILVIIGASGSGKTAVVDMLRERSLPGVQFYHFDDWRIPDPEEMVQAFGSVEGWQAAQTARWIDHLIEDPDGARVYVLVGQTRPSFVLPPLQEHGIVAEIVLLDCTTEVRDERLAGRRQLELASAEMDAWAAYLRGQADALALPIIDTGGSPLAETATRLAAQIESLRARVT